MFTKTLWSIAALAALSMGAPSFASTGPVATTTGCCSDQGCCEGCPDCSCDQGCCDNCADGCDCTCES